MSWFDRFKQSAYVSGSAGVVGASASVSSAKPRQALDFRQQPARSSADCGLRHRFVQTFRRRKVAPEPGALARPQAGAACGLPKGSRGTGQVTNEALMSARLARALPTLQRIPADATLYLQRRDKLAIALLELQSRCVYANEQGLSIDRVLAALQQRGAGLTTPQTLSMAEEFLLGLNECLGREAAGGTPTREGLARAALLLVMPALSLNPHKTRLIDPGHEQQHKQRHEQRVKVHRLAKELAKDLALLDSRFAGRPGYAFDRLFTVLCNHARILEYGRDVESLEKALSGLQAMVLTVQESIASGRDGSELNALLGIDNELDKAIVEVRVEAVTRFMVEHGDASVDRPATAKEDARTLVQQEYELALARVRVMRAFDRAGIPRPIEVLRGLRMDAALVGGLAQQLGTRAEKVGLAIMAVHLRERDLAESKSAQRMLRCVQGAMKKAGDRVEAFQVLDARLRVEAGSGYVRGDESSKEAWRKANRLADARTNVPADRALLRALAPREASLKKPASAGALEHNRVLMERLGLTGMDMKHVRQLERQGLSSAAEAHGALAAVRKSVQTWLAAEGPESMKKQGLLDVLRTRRQEDRAGQLSEALRAKHREALEFPDGSVKPIAADEDGQRVRRDIVRAAIAHLVPEARDAAPKGLPVLASFLPEPAAVRDVLVSWGRTEDFTDDEITAELVHGGPDERVPGVTNETLSQWANDAELLGGPAAGNDVPVPPAKRFELPQGDDHARGVVMLHATRAAVMENWVSTAGAHPKSQTIRDVLLKWGVAEVPEKVITDALAEPMTQDTFDAWKKEADAAEARWEVVRSIADMKIGTRVRQNELETMRVSSGTLGNTVGVGVTVSVGEMTGLDFGNPGDPGGSFEVVVRAGFDVKVGVSASVPLTQWGAAKVGPVASIGGSVQHYSGVVLRCKTTQAHQALTRKLIERKQIGFDELAEVESLMLLRETQGSVEGGGGAQAMMQPTDDGFSWDQSRSTFLKIGLRLSGHRVWKRAVSTAENNRHKIVRDETVWATRVALTASANVTLQSSQNDQPTLSAPLLEAGLSLEDVDKHRVRTFATDSGEIVDAEAFQQAFVAGSSAVELVMKLGGEKFRRTMAYFEQENPAVHDYIIGLITDLRRNELASLAYKLDPNAGMYVGNALIHEANALSEHRMHSGGIKQNKAAAKQDRKEAEHVFNDRSRYNLARVAAIPVMEEMNAVSCLTALVEKSRAFTAESLPEEIKLYEATLADLASRAREEVNASVPRK